MKNIFEDEGGLFADLSQQMKDDMQQLLTDMESDFTSLLDKLLRVEVSNFEAQISALFESQQKLSNNQYYGENIDVWGGLFGGRQSSIVEQVLGNAFNSALGSISRGRKINSRQILRSGANRVGKYIGQEIGNSWNSNSQNIGFRFSRSQAASEASVELRRGN